MTEQITNRRAEDKNMQVLATKIEGLAQDMNEMKHGIAKMADALTKLAIVEERQTQTILAQERAFKALERVEERQRQHELQCRDQEKGLRQLIADSNERLPPVWASWKKPSPCRPKPANGSRQACGVPWPCWSRSSCRAFLSGCFNEPRAGAGAKNHAGGRRWRHKVGFPPSSKQASPP